MITTALEIDPNIFAILTKAKTGDENAINDTLTIIRYNHMRTAIGRYLNKNRLVDDEDIIQEFMIGVADAIPDVDMNIGNPVLYLVNRGIWKVRSYFRKHVFTNTMQTCLQCGHTCRPNKCIRKDGVVIKRSHDWVCPRCGATGDRIDIKQLTGSEVKEDNAWCNRTEELIEDVVLDEISIQEFRGKLNGRVLQLFDAMVSGVDRDNSVSYMREMADKWGCSTACVAQYLKRLKKAWVEHFSLAAEVVIDRRLSDD